MSVWYQPKLRRRISKRNCFRIFLIIPLVWTLGSCVSIRNNYLGRGINSGEDSIPLRIPTECGKKLLRSEADSLLKVISEQKRKNQHILAREINQLYTGLGEQLENDRYYQHQLLDWPVRKDSLSCIQYRASLELLSSAAYFEESYQKIGPVRRNINRGDEGNHIPKHILQKSRNFLYSPSVRKTLKLGTMRYSDPEADSIFQNLPRTNTCIALRRRFFPTNDRLRALAYHILYGGSYVFGNTVGFFHLNSNREENAKLLGTQVQPFDLVLMKSPMHLTDQFIPGYFGHVGIWLGNDWISKLVHRPARKDDLKGKTVVEVLRSGVKISTLKEFCDGDIFLIVRPAQLTENQKREILGNIRKQLKKSYDFNFDIESPESISCTELVYLAYDFIDWETRYTWDRFTLSPDDLVITALKSDKFEFPSFIQNGSVVIRPDTTFIRSLVGSPVYK